MAVRLVFLWWANSLLTFATVTQLLLAALAAWAMASMFGTKLLAWIFAEQEMTGKDLS